MYIIVESRAYRIRPSVNLFPVRTAFGTQRNGSTVEWRVRSEMASRSSVSACIPAAGSQIGSMRNEGLGVLRQVGSMKCTATSL